MRGQWPITPGLPLLRRHLQTFGALVGLPTRRLHGLLLAADEAAAAVIVSGSHSATLTVWTDETGVNLKIIDPQGSLPHAPADVSSASRASSPDMIAQVIILGLCHVVTQHRDHRGSRVHLRLLSVPAPALSADAWTGDPAAS